MTKAHVNKLDDQDLSALLDGEEFLTDQEIAAKESETLGRYALIGDVMRAESDDAFVIDISASVAQALESEPVYADFSQKQDAEIAPSDSDNVVAFNWRRPVAQLAIAASVAMFAIVGVQTLPQSDSSPMNEIPMLQSTPLTGIASPVSYSSEPAIENAEKGIRELQQQRIGALVLEHQRQARVAYSLEKAHTEAQAEEEKN